MRISTKIEPIDRTIGLLIDANLSPAAQSRLFAQFAGEQIDEAKQANRLILGRVPRYTVAVDGRRGAALETVKPDGIIVAEFELIDDVLKWIGDQLEKHSPVKTGRFQRSHTLFADGQETRVGGIIPNAAEYVFTTLLPYARKLERGASTQAPDGVYQAVAKLASARFGNIAKITFTYRTAIAGAFVGGRIGNRSEQRNPAILVKVR